MNRVGTLFAALVVIALIAAPARAQDTDLAAGALFEKALENMTKQEGFHVKLGAEVSLGEGMAPMSITSEGWVRNPDIAYFKMVAMGGMETETYRKGKQSARKDATGQWQLEEGDGGLGDQRLGNPLEYLNEFKKHSKDAVYLDNEKLGDIECRVVKANPPAEAIRGFIGGIGIPEAAIDWNKAKLAFRVWIGKEDVLVRQVIADLEVELAGLGGDTGLDDPAFDEGDEKGKGDGAKKNDHPKEDGAKKDDHPKEDGAKKDDHPKGDGAKKDDHPKGDGAKKDDGKGGKDDDDFGFEDGGDEFGQPMKLTPRAKFEIFDYNKNVGIDQIPEAVRTKLKITG